MSRQVLGVSCGTYRRHGCFAEYVVVPQHAVYVIPDSLTFVQASLLEPLTIALHALRLGGSGAHTNSAVVVGCGTIGLTLISALAAKGCRAIAAIDIDASRLATAKKHGATIGFSGNDSDVAAGVVAWAKQHGSGDGADLVVEAVGTTAAVQIAIDSAARGATVVLVGNVSPRIEFALQTVVTRQLRILGSCSSAGCYPEAIELVASGRVDLDHLVSRVAPLSEGAEWFRRLVQREDGLVKVVLEP
jgi:L-iditol 2-dehydrogenase